VSLDDHGDIAVEPLETLLVQTLQDVVAKVRNRHLKGLGHGALRTPPQGLERERDIRNIF
jgi:hypothetical protein